MVLGDEFSNWEKVYSGVPQGSVMGLILFTVFINDIDEGIRNKILKFVDDRKLIGKVATSKEVDILRSDLSQLFDLSEKWQLNFNVSIK